MVPTEEAHRPPAVDRQLTLLAVRMLYIALSFFFASFYVGFGFLQFINAHGRWLPASVRQPSLALGVINLALVLAAGLAWWMGVRARRLDRMQLCLWAAVAASAAAVVAHILVLRDPGFTPQAGGYASTFTVIEGTFSAMLLLTVIALAGLANRTRLGFYRQSSPAVQAGGEILAWLCALAVLNFLALYVEAFHPL